MANDRYLRALPTQVIRPEDPFMVSEPVAVAAFIAGLHCSAGQSPPPVPVRAIPSDRVARSAGSSELTVGIGRGRKPSGSSLKWMSAIEIEFLEPNDVRLLGEIDRSEQLEIEYRVDGGKLVSSQSKIVVPAWDRVGSGDHSVNKLIAFCEPYLNGGAQLLGAFEDDVVVGIAVVEPRLCPNLGWLALLHVSDGQRRSGVGQALWDESLGVAADSGATAIYVSATPTGSAVGFYLKQGCRLADRDEMVQELFVLEPDDVHLVCAL